ncbi:MAG: MBL fold metallo-hydrolase [Acidimicrobiales bacterium]
MTDESGRQPATEHTIAAQRAFAASCPRRPRRLEARDPRLHRPPGRVDDHERGRGGRLGSGRLGHEQLGLRAGRRARHRQSSLWRQAKLNGEHGLFEVVPGFYQVRSFDTSVVTFVRGDTGWVVIDPLTAQECARAAYQLVRDELEDLPVTAVIYTHTHVDHYGGVLGVVSREQVDSGVPDRGPGRVRRGRGGRERGGRCRDGPTGHLPVRHVAPLGRTGARRPGAEQGPAHRVDRQLIPRPSTSPRPARS